MTDVNNRDLMLAINELGEKLNGVADDVTGLKSDVADLKTDVAEMKSSIGKLETEQKTMREEMNGNFRKLDKKITIFADDLIDVRADIKLLEDKTS